MLITTLGIFLRAAPYLYTTMMFPHALVVGLIIIALWAIDREPAFDARGFWKKPLPHAGWERVVPVTSGHARPSTKP